MIVGIEWYEWVGQCEKIPTVLIMDETQMIYESMEKVDVSMKNTGNADEFWNIIKVCLQSDKP